MRRKRNRNAKKFVVCLWNKDYPASLQLLKIYERLPDARAERDELIRVIDEEGEGYLYPAKWFLALDLEKDAEEALEAAAELQIA